MVVLLYIQYLHYICATASSYLFLITNECDDYRKKLNKLLHRLLQLGFKNHITINRTFVTDRALRQFEPPIPRRKPPQKNMKKIGANGIRTPVGFE